jgi:hypothetical protein
MDTRSTYCPGNKPYVVYLPLVPDFSDTYKQTVDYLKFRVLWDVLPCSQVHVDNTHLHDYPAVPPRRL